VRAEKEIFWRVMMTQTRKKSLKEVERHRFLYVPKTNSQAMRSKTSIEAYRGKFTRVLLGIFPSKRRRKEMRMEITRTEQSINNLPRNRQNGDSMRTLNEELFTLCFIFVFKIYSSPLFMSI
jgi:hypothetical protein